MYWEKDRKGMTLWKIWLVVSRVLFSCSIQTWDDVPSWKNTLVMVGISNCLIVAKGGADPQLLATEENVMDDVLSLLNTYLHNRFNSIV